MAEAASTAGGLPIRPEAELLFCAAGVDDSDGRVERIRILLDLDLDWDYVLDCTNHHAIPSLLYWRLNQVGLGLVPVDVVEKLRVEKATVVRRNLLLVSELVAVTKLFEAASIPLLPYKGPVQARLLYGDISHRHIWDLDVLVVESDVARARKLLVDNGYTPEDSHDRGRESRLRAWDCEEVFFTPIHGQSLELHWRLMPPVMGGAASANFVWNHVRPGKHFGARMLTLSPECAAVVSFLHADIKHRWGELKLLADVARIVANYPEMDWHKVLELAARLDEERAILLGVYLASVLLNAPMPSVVHARLARYPQALAYAGLVLGRLSRKGFGLPGFQEWREFVRAFRSIRADWGREWSPIEERLRYTRAIATPEFNDKYVLPGLPAVLSALHYISRPARLAIRHGPSLVRRLR